MLHARCTGASCDQNDNEVAYFQSVMSMTEDIQDDYQWEGLFGLMV